MTRFLTPVFLGVLLVAVPALAQDAAQGGTRGPMLIEQVRNGFVIAPEYRITDVGSSVGHLVGAYGGVVIENTLFIGGAGYWLTNDTAVSSMGYGGAVVEWLQHANGPVGLSLRGLAGFGGATVTEQVVGIPQYFGRQTRFGDPSTGARSFTVYSTRDFFVAEPQAGVLLNFTGKLRLNVGAGYRLIAGAGSANDQLRGVTGNISLEIGGSSTRVVSKP